MGENDIEVIEVSSASSCDDKKVKKVFGSNSSSPGSESGTPIGHILCLKNSDDVKRFEETEDCFILDFDPFQPIDLSKLFVSAAVDDGYAPDLAIVAETGQVRFKIAICLAAKKIVGKSFLLYYYYYY